jgi:hypothetical protein
MDPAITNRPKEKHTANEIAPKIPRCNPEIIVECLFGGSGSVSDLCIHEERQFSRLSPAIVTTPAGHR